MNKTVSLIRYFQETIYGIQNTSNADNRIFNPFLTEAVII